MVSVLVCMAVGIFLGLKVIPAKYQKINGLLQYVFIAVLIFCMGAGLGSSPTFFEELAHMGLQALSFAAIPIALSVAGVALVTKYILKENKR